MQSISPLTSADILAKAQTVLYKFEIYYGGDWVNVGADLKSVSVSPSGSGPTPDIIAGTWSAEVANDENEYHPLNLGSTKHDYFTVGRKVRISIGADFSGSPTYWQRIIGYMDAPKFDHRGRVVELKGCDYAKRLTDFALRDGTNYWGSSQTFSTVATSTAYGAEIYDEADVLEVGAHEANNITNWTDDANCTASAVADVALGSTYVMQIEKDTDSMGWATNANVGAMTAGTLYECSFDYYRHTGDDGIVMAMIYEADGSPLVGYSDEGESVTAAKLTFQFTATSSTDMMLKFKVTGTTGVKFRVDNVTIKSVTTPGLNTTYVLPDTSTGAYYATLDGAPIWSDDPPAKMGWQESGNVFTFVDGAAVNGGTDNLVVYYFTAETVEHAVANILSQAGLYASEAAALSDMDYTATSVDLDQVWFEAGTTALEAIRMLCERVNYRFWFGYDGKPHFKAAPAVAAAAFTLTSYGHLSGMDTEQDLEQIRNRVIIEGIEKADTVSNEKKKKTRMTGSSSDATSISTYGEHTETITNHLFQDQTSINTIAAARVASGKDPKWYADLDLPVIVAPLEIGDTLDFAARYDSGMMEYGHTGIIRGMSIDNSMMRLRLELHEPEFGLSELVVTCTLPAPTISTPPQKTVEPSPITGTFSVGTPEVLIE